MASDLFSVNLSKVDADQGTIASFSDDGSQGSTISCRAILMGLNEVDRAGAPARGYLTRGQGLVHAN